MMVEIQDLCKKYGDVMALEHLELKIPKGELFGFVGPNGAGKTTLFRIMAGLLRADSGNVRVAGIDILKESALLGEKIGYVPDFFGVYDNFKVIEYMEFYASLYGIYGEKARKRCLALMGKMQMGEKSEMMVDSLSRGMKQRLCLARSLIHEPELLILDEPVSGMDPRARQGVKEILRELHESGMSIIISSHILSELSELCTSIGIIEQGQMVVQGSLEEIDRKVTAGRLVAIEVTGRREQAVELLKEQDHIRTISLEDNRIVVGFQGSQEEQAALLRFLIEQGIPVVSFRRQTGDLELAFMKVTEKKELLATNGDFIVRRKGEDYEV